MKILYLKLKNFSTIYTAMNKKEIEIDFTKCKNNIVLLVGCNGSGKTSILSTLHPFAYAGSMDIRNNSNLIIEDKDGYKEIHIKDNDNIYKIQHFYKNTKKGIQVKSFIQKNGEELNKNGNVTSFNDIVKAELSLELDFLRLLRLGSNVSNLIDMKTSERKSFTSELLSDINVYTELFKKINDDNRLLKNLLRTVSDKINKLNISDRDIVVSEIETLKRNIEKYTSEKSKYQIELGNLEGRMKEILPEGVKSANDTLIHLNEEKSDNDINIGILNSKIKQLCIVLTCSIDDEIGATEREINELENKSNYNTSMLTFYNKELSKLYDEDEENDNKIRTFTSNVEYNQIASLEIELTKKVKEFEKRFINYTPIYTKDNLISILNISKEIDRIIRDIFEYDMKAINKTIELIKGSINVNSYVNSELNRIEKDMIKITAKFKNSNSMNSPIILFRPPECCVNDCPYLFLYDLLFSESNDDDKKSLTSLDNEKELLNDITAVSKNFDYIFMLLKTNAQLISKTNMDCLSVNNILNTVSAGRVLNLEDYITELVSEVEDYDDYQSMKVKLKEITAEIKMMNNNKDHIELLTENKKKIFGKISEMLKTIQGYKNEDEDIQKRMARLNNYKNNLLSYKSTSDVLNKLIEENDALKSEIKSLNEKISNVSYFVTSMKELSNKIEYIEWEIKKLNEELINKQLIIKEFDSLSKERDTLNDKFDDMNILRESLSSTKGIPLLFIQLYLKNTKMYVNNLLELVYSSGFEIDDFEITSTDFNIPYIKNGMRINDVSYASQGEKSFLSLALSFALITQSIKNYNILLLDEIDSTLDIRNRAMFLTILEKQMDIIDAEQIFLITHNNMFDNYPVDIILTSQDKSDRYENANIIFTV